MAVCMGTNGVCRTPETLPPSGGVVPISPWNLGRIQGPGGPRPTALDVLPGADAWEAQKSLLETLVARDLELSSKVRVLSQNLETCQKNLLVLLEAYEHPGRTFVRPEKVRDFASQVEAIRQHNSI